MVQHRLCGHAGEFLCIACANGRLSMHSRAGVSLGVIATVDAKVAHIALQPGGTKICIACLDGSLAMLQLTFLTVHSLYQDIYACRLVSCSLQYNSLTRGMSHACGRCKINFRLQGAQTSMLCPREPVAARGRPARQVPG